MIHLKKTITLFSLIFALGACSANAKESKTTKNDKHMKTVQMTQADFIKKIADYESNPTTWQYLGDKPSIVDFYATWCGPCKSLAPVLDELAGEYAGKVDIYKVDVDKEPELAAAFGIQSIPTLLIIPMKGKPMIIRGAQPKHELKRIIENELLNK